MPSQTRIACRVSGAVGPYMPIPPERQSQGGRLRRHRARYHGTASFARSEKSNSHSPHSSCAYKCSSHCDNYPHHNYHCHSRRGGIKMSQLAQRTFQRLLLPPLLPPLVLHLLYPATTTKKINLKTITERDTTLSQSCKIFLMMRIHATTTAMVSTLPQNKG